MASQWIPISLIQSAFPKVFSGNVECHYNYLDQHLKFKGVFRQNIKIRTIKIKYYKQWVRCKYNLESSKEATHLIINAWLSTLDRQVFEDGYLCEINAISTIDQQQPNDFTTWAIINIPYFETKTVMNFYPLPQYVPERTITDVFKKNFKEDSRFGSNLARLLCSNLNEYYTMSREQRVCHSNQLFEMFHKALNIEDLQVEKELSQYELDDVHVKFDSCQDDKFIYCLWSDSEILQEDSSAFSVCLIPMKFYSKNYNGPKHMFSGKITKYVDNFVYFERNKKVNNFHKPASKNTVYHVQFIPNRKSIRAAHLALETIENLPFFLSFTNDCSPPGAVFPEGSFNWVNEHVASNKEQKQAIVNIVNCSSFRAPYIIFGPPGTGKTSTLVEAVAQILKMKPKSKILITAQSNSACDEIGFRLLNSVSRNKIYRYYSQLFSEEIIKEMKSISNFHTGKHLLPTSEEFYHFNVVIVTLVSSSCFVQKIKDKHHFDYIFIDECAASIEPESLIPIAGFGVVNGKLSSQIVLLGDHKQLGAVTQSEYASNLCLNVSLMERMMHMEQYSNNDPKYVTQLLDNYRSHPAILKYSNDHFYDGKLRAKVPEGISDFALNWKFLPNKTFPIVLHSSLSPCWKKKGGTSWFNIGEVKEIVFLVDLILKNGIGSKKINEGDIGVMSFYKAQEDELKKALHATPLIEVGTVEYYQGREKLIMIISTVKSNSAVGFLKQEKRINVGLTRAQSLMILVCNPETLQKDPLWYDFVKYCYDNKACGGSEFRMHIKSPQQIDEEECKTEVIGGERFQLKDETIQKETPMIAQATYDKEQSIERKRLEDEVDQQRILEHQIDQKLAQVKYNKELAIERKKFHRKRHLEHRKAQRLAQAKHDKEQAIEKKTLEAVANQQRDLEHQRAQQLAQAKHDKEQAIEKNRLKAIANQQKDLEHQRAQQLAQAKYNETQIKMKRMLESKANYYQGLKPHTERRIQNSYDYDNNYHFSRPDFGGYDWYLKNNMDPLFNEPETKKSSSKLWYVVGLSIAAYMAYRRFK